MNDPTLSELHALFFPYAARKVTKARDEKARFVYYTNADTAKRILQGRQIWMRNAMVMNDFSEIHYGRSCLTYAYNEARCGEQLRGLLAPYFPNLLDVVEKQLNEWMHSFVKDTYITCVSEHLADEDDEGRLSMWRAYGGNNGVAIVVNSAPFLADSDALHAYTMPVAYWSRNEFATMLGELIEGLSNNIDLLQQQGEDMVRSWLFYAMRLSLLTTKHPGFWEEREWRIFHSPTIEPSERMTSSVEIVHGVAQRVFKLPIKNVPEEGFVGAELHELIDRVIIGPTKFPVVVADAFNSLLEEAGVSNSASKIAISGIPLRM